MQSSGTDPRNAPIPVEQALDKNRAATEEVKRATEDLAVIHAVLDSRVVPPAGDHEVEKAVAETKEVERRLADATDALQEVNTTLERTVKSKTSA